MILRSLRVVLPDGVRPATIHIEHGTITRVMEREASASAEASADKSAGRSDAIDAGDLVISPGLVDTHVHVNEPGRTEWEGFDTATRAAAAGGVTTIVDMPLNSIPATTTAAALEQKRAAARGTVHVDVGFWGGVVPGNEGELDALVDAGVRGFKCFLVPSGVDEFPNVDEADLRRALPIIARRKVPLLVHAESPSILESQINPQSPIPDPKYTSYLATRPPEAEVDAIRLMVRLAREFDVHVHIVHVACAEGVTEIARAKADGVRITAETCPHYLTFMSEEIPNGATEFKCAPPIRERGHRAALWQGLLIGVLDLIATDHSPAPPAMKAPGDFMRAWGGIASLETSLAAVWSSHPGARRAAFSGSPDRGPERAALQVLGRWLSEAPAALAGIGHRKGRIAAGCDADLVIWDPDAEWTVDAARLQQRHKLSPYANRRLRGRVKTTIVRGHRVWDNDALVGSALGELL